MPLFLRIGVMCKIEIWVLKTSCINDSNINEYEQYLTEERWNKVKQIRGEERKRSIAAGLLLNRLSKELEIQDPCYDCKKNGKPFFNTKNGVEFNLSHSGEYVLLAFIREGKAHIGIDIQEYRKFNKALENRVLSKKEKECQLTEQVNIIEVWAMKEAFSKMTGEGLSVDFRNLTIEMDSKICFNMQNNVIGYLERIEIDELYEAYVCCSSVIDQILIENIRI